MSRFKLVLLSALAVLGVFAIASASASAAPLYLVCLEKSNGNYEDSLCTVPNTGKGDWESYEVTTALAIEGTLGLSDLTSTIDKTAATITCAKGTVTGSIEASGKSKATIVYEECSIAAFSGCEVPNITAKVTDKLIETGTTIEDEFNEEGSGPFATITFKGSGCGIKSLSLKVKGSQICALAEGEVSKSLHLLDCEESGSKLKLGEEAAKYKGSASIQLVSHDAFRVDK